MDNIQSLLTVAVEFLPAQIWDCVKEHGNVKFVLLERTFCKAQVDTSVLCSLTRNLSKLSKVVIDKYNLLDERYPLTESILFSIATLFYFWLTRRKTALLLKPLLLKRCDQSFMNSNLKDIENRIFSRLQHNMESKGLQLVESSWNLADDGQKPVIVFCVLSSRIGTDIENAIRGVHGSSPVVLVLLHCVLSSLLRGDLSDDEELLDTTLRNRMTGIAHFAFSDHEGLYDCHQNTVGFNKLLDAVISTTMSETLYAKTLFSSS